MSRKEPGSGTWQGLAILTGPVIVLILGGFLWAVSGVPSARWGYLAALLGLLWALGYAYVRREAWRHLVTGRLLREGTNAAVLTVAVLGVVVLANVILGRNPVRFDLTVNRAYTLSPQTRAVLADLPEPVTVYAFLRNESATEVRLGDLLKEYAHASPRFRLHVVDPNVNPGLARQYGVESYGTVVFTLGERQKLVEPYELYGFGADENVREFRGEQAFTQALVDLTRGNLGKVYFVTGHGEPSLQAELLRAARYLEGEGYTPESLHLAQSGGVPQEAAAVVLAGPRRDLDPAEVEALDRYLRGGGRVFALIGAPEPGEPKLSRLESFLARWGVQLDPAVVVDPNRHYFLDVLSPIPLFEPHTLTDRLIQDQLAVVLPRARSLRLSTAPPEGLAVQRLLFTSDAAWGETDLATTSVRRDAGDLSGPLTLGAVVTQGPGQGSSGAAEGAKAEESRLVVVGNSIFLTNDVLTFQGNVDFFINTVNWLAGKENLITIRPKTEEFRRVRLSAAQSNLIFYTTVVLMPVAVLLTGGLIWWRRRAL